MAMPLAQHIFKVNQRRAERDEICIEIRLRRKSPPVSPPNPALLLNLSPLGFMVRTDMTIIDGSMVSIELPIIGEVKARSIWSMEQNLGAEFLKPIDPHSYGQIMAVIDRERGETA